MAKFLYCVIFIQILPTKIPFSSLQSNFIMLVKIYVNMNVEKLNNKFHVLILPIRRLRADTRVATKNLRIFSERIIKESIIKGEC